MNSEPQMDADKRGFFGNDQTRIENGSLSPQRQKQMGETHQSALICVHQRFQSFSSVFSVPSVLSVINPYL